MGRATFLFPQRQTYSNDCFCHHWDMFCYSFTKEKLMKTGHSIVARCLRGSVYWLLAQTLAKHIQEKIAANLNNLFILLSPQELCESAIWLEATLLVCYAARHSRDTLELAEEGTHLRIVVWQKRWDYTLSLLNHRKEKNGREHFFILLESWIELLKILETRVCWGHQEHLSGRM